MATKKPGGSRASSEARNFTVVLEDIRAQFSVFGEALHGMREHMEARFEAVDERFDGIDRRFEAVDRRFEAVDSRFDRMDHELGLVKTVVLENSRELKDHGLELKQIRLAAAVTSGVLDEKVGRAEVVEFVERAVEKQRR